MRSGRAAKKCSIVLGLAFAAVTLVPGDHVQTVPFFGLNASVIDGGTSSASTGSTTVSAVARAVAAPGRRGDQVLDVYGRLPLTFVENRGQTDTRVRYYLQGPRHAVYLTREKIVLTLVKTPDVPGRNDASPEAHSSMLGARDSMVVANATTAEKVATRRGVSLALRFLRSNPQVVLEGEDRTPGDVNYFRGNDPAHWRTQVPRYAQIVYRELWPGVDLRLREQAATLKYEFRVRPGARLADIRMAYTGATGLTLDGTGRLLIETALGVLRDSPPVSYHEIDGVRVPVDSRYVLEEGGSAERGYGFAVGAGYSPDHELIIDPGLDYSTFLGGASHDYGTGIAIDASGNAYVVGVTQSVDFPTTPDAFDTALAGPSNPPDVFVSKLDSTGSALIYSTYLGGGANDFGRAIAIDAAGNAYVTGQTTSRDFPTTGGAFITTTPEPPPLGSPNDAFVTKLNATGSALVYSTFLGGGQDIDDGLGIAVDDAGNAYVAGETGSNDFPTTAGAFDRTWNGAYDAFVAKLNAAGSALVYSTYLGGLEVDFGEHVAVDAAGNAYVVGSTRSANFPTTAGAFDRNPNGAFDVFVVKLNTAGSAPVYSTLLGGLDFDSGEGLALDAAGNAHVAGGTLSPDFPTTPGAFDTFLDGGSDAFVAKLNASGSELVYATFLGGTAGEGVGAIALDAAGTAWVTGGTSSWDFPTTPDAVSPAFSGGSSDVFVTQLDATGSALGYSTFLGGTNSENGSALALDAGGNIYVTGRTLSADFVTTAAAFDTLFDGDTAIFWGDAFITKLADGPPPSPSPSLSSLTLNPTSVTGGTSSTGTATLSAAAPAGGSVVTLSSNSTAAAVPASVTVAAGATGATFTVSTSGVTTNTTAVITGTLGATRTASLTLTPPPVPVAPTLVSPANGATVAQPVTLDWNNVANATSYEVQVDDSSTISAPFIANPTVTVSQATLSGLPAQRLWWRVRARNAAGVAGPFSSTRRFTPTAAPATASLSSVSVSPTTVVGPASATGTVTLTAGAPTGGAVVTLTSSNAGVASVPGSVTVAAGATTATFTISTMAVAASTSVTLTGTYNGVNRTATLTVTPSPPPASLSSLAFSPTSVTGGTSSTGTVTLTSAAPTGGAVVTLAEDSPATTVPANVTVAAGATTATFTVTTSTVTASTVSTITAAYDGVTRSATVTVNPAPATTALTVTATGRSGERVTSSPAGINVLVGSTGSASFAVNTSITLRVSNDRDAIWSGACSSGGNKTKTCTFTLTGNASVTANVQ